MTKLGRPVGSKNKIPKSFSVGVEFDKELLGAPMTKDNPSWKIVNWGMKNNYPQLMSELYVNSPTMNRCVNFLQAAILGDGIDYDKMEIAESDLVPNYKYDWETMIKSLSIDKILTGSFAMQIIKNKDGKTYSYFHQPISTVRCAPYDEEGNINTYYISQDWTNPSKYTPVEIESVMMTEDINLKIGKPYLYVYTEYSPDVTYYTVPVFIAGIKAIQAEIQALRYDLRAYTNNFSASGIVSMPRVESEEEKYELLRQFKSLYEGSDNANSLIVTFRNNKEDEPIEFTRIEKDSTNVNLFSDADKRSTNRILCSFGIPNPQLIGLPSESTASLGGDGNALNVAYNLVNKNVISPMRNTIVGTINRTFKLNGIDTKLILKPLTFNITEDKVDTTDVTRVKQPEISEIKDNNVTEQEGGQYATSR